MGLMKGGFYSLLEGKPTSPDRLNQTANLMLTHMLQALVWKHTHTFPFLPVMYLPSEERENFRFTQ